VTGYHDWKMLRRYTNSKPESLHPQGKQAGFEATSLIPDVLADMLDQQ
jgi:hypothetical protein